MSKRGVKCFFANNSTGSHNKTKLQTIKHSLATGNTAMKTCLSINGFTPINMLFTEFVRPTM